MKTELLKKIRGLAALSQKAFAKRCFNTYASKVQHWEEGTRPLKPEYGKIYIKIAKKHGLNITLDDLYE